MLASLWLGSLLLVRCVSDRRGSRGGADDRAAARQARAAQPGAQDCGSCHGLTLKGGLGQPLLPGKLGGIARSAIARGHSRRRARARRCRLGVRLISRGRGRLDRCVT